ncbi:hypothetical protein JP0272_14780 [Helicobacter pylori]
MLDRAILDIKLDSRPMDLSFLDDILKHMQKPRFSDSDKVDKRLLISSINLTLTQSLLNLI